MGTFSFGDAFGAGFRLLAREPLAMLTWAGAFLLIGLAPQIWMFASLAPDFAVFIQESQAASDTGGAGPEVQRLMALQARMMIFQPVMMISQAVSSAVLIAAIFRAVLEPENRRFAYLRLGGQELWLGLVSLVLGVLLVFGMMLAIIPLSIIIGIIAATAGEGAGGAVGALVGVLAALGLMGAAAWVALRFSMALPMTFSERTFRLFESWELTRGQAAKLFGLALALFAVTALVQGLVIGVAIAAFVANLEDLKAFAERPPAGWFAAAAPWIALGAVAIALFTAVIHAIWLAPFAEAYRQLTTPEPEDLAPALAP